MPTASILGESDDHVRMAARLLREGELVALPTETVYGLAGNARLETTVRSIFTVKGRPLIDPLIVHVHDFSQVEELCADVPPIAHQLAEAFWPGPLTLILPKAPQVSDLLTAGHPTVAVRMPAHPLARRILQAADVPLAAPSANPFGYISPTCAEHVQESLGERIGWIVDGGPCQKGIESTIIDVSTPGEIRLLRPGPLTGEQISEALNGLPVTTPAATSSDKPVAPGMLTRHYSPHTPLTLVPNGQLPPAIPPTAPEGSSAWLATARPRADASSPAYTRYWFSETGALEDISQSLFGMLRKLDQAGHSHIYVELPPSDGLGLSLIDRLNRAAAR
ncbi:threonylcarbamoyl-AMP synthase [Ruficoccus amylovorans]|uniref:Threonylcarbamoyl-AMP synthase n=1 Tax=Ruficoccus amylovorans TaxID=1804625 RepID=A0A842HK89_9BACT|nr:L-threonylcarbamoyladenylate synthase [Ruficoccus amylovorans]MBC2596084.1 threonylcarbamoyl-AMP synthase [Ruficoccus amylovorans]